MNKQAFTLIELLIVVAIIAILAAIAVPNFLEAQTRSKIARVQNDMRSLATGIQSYLVDYNGKIVTNRQATQTREYVLSNITTPVAYMTAVPRDPFNRDPGPTGRTQDTGNQTVTVWGADMMAYDESGASTSQPTKDGGTYPSWTKATMLTLLGDPSKTDVSRGFFSRCIENRPPFLLFSLGPDTKFSVTDPWPSLLMPYDATNGTVSRGDIVREPGQ